MDDFLFWVVLVWLHLFYMVLLDVYIYVGFRCFRLREFIRMTRFYAMIAFGFNGLLTLMIIILMRFILLLLFMACLRLWSITSCCQCLRNRLSARYIGFKIVMCSSELHLAINHWNHYCSKSSLFFRNHPNIFISFSNYFIL